MGEGRITQAQRQELWRYQHPANKMPSTYAAADRLIGRYKAMRARVEGRPIVQQLKQAHRREVQRKRRTQWYSREERHAWAQAQARHQNLDREMDAAIAGAG